MKTTVIGAFPKISDGPGGQDLRKALHRFDAGEIDESGLADVLDRRTRDAIGEIEGVGVDVVNDGQIRWDDLFAPLARSWRNVSRGPLERFYDNNTYFRQPVIEGPIETDGTTFVRDFTLARGLVKRARLKAAVPGPVTFAALAQDRHYRSFEDRLLAAADAIASEIAALVAAGATLVDVEDPGLVAAPQHIESAREAYHRLVKAGPIAIQTYFFPADRVLEALASFSAAQVGIDLRSRETTALRRLDAFRTGTLVLGVIDARNTRLETEAEVAALVDAALRLVPRERLWIAPTTGLEYLPHDVAIKKLQLLVQAARTGTEVTA